MTGVFSFLGWILESIQVLVHSYLPFLNFFGQVMHFCKSNWTKQWALHWPPHYGSSHQWFNLDCRDRGEGKEVQFLATPVLLLLFKLWFDDQPKPPCHAPLLPLLLAIGCLLLFFVKPHSFSPSFCSISSRFNNSFC